MPDAEKTIDAQCPHTALTPHWDQPADMGKSELATYSCEACSATFSNAEAQQYLNRAPTVLSSVGDEQRR
jgi:hypothetical protein